MVRAQAYQLLEYKDLLQHQIGHFVGSVLEDLGYGQVGMVVNPRTGRMVRGITSVTCPRWLEKFRNQLAFSKQ